MGKERDVSFDKGKMSPLRYRELRYFCLQYPEWKAELQSCAGMLFSDKATNDRLESLAWNCRLIENTVEEVDPEIAPYLLEDVTDPEKGFTYLSMRENLPCCRNYYYAARRRFFEKLSERYHIYSGGEAV